MYERDWAEGRVKSFRDRLAVKLREPGGLEHDAELLVAIEVAKGLVRSSTWSVDRVVYEAEGAWTEFCRHCQKLERKLSPTDQRELPPLVRVESMINAHPDAAKPNPFMDPDRLNQLVDVLSAERALSMRVLPFVVGNAYDLEGPEAGVDELIRHGLCAVGDAARDCRGERSMNVQIALLAPVTRSMFSRAGIPYHTGLESHGLPASVRGPGAQRVQRPSSRRPPHRVVMLPLVHSTAEVCTSVGSRAELRAALQRYADPMAEGEDAPLGRLIAALPLIFLSIRRLRWERLLDQKWFATRIGIAQRCWAGLHPDGARLPAREDPVRVAERWLHTPAVLTGSILDDPPEHGSGWGGLPPLTGAQQRAEQQFLLALVPFVVHRSILNTHRRQGRSLPVLLGLRTALAKTVIPRGGRVPVLHEAVLRPVERTTGQFAGRADELWWVEEVPEKVEVWLDYLALRVRCARSRGRVS
jgi:hypothetical protein